MFRVSRVLVGGGVFSRGEGVRNLVSGDVARQRGFGLLR